MFLRLLYESFVRQRRRKALAAIAILLGTTAVTAMLALATTIGDRIHRELAVYGANIVVFPKAESLAVNVAGVDLKPSTGGAHLHESDLARLKTIFWANNITGLSPELPLTIVLGAPSFASSAKGGVSFAEAYDRSSISSPAKASGATSSTSGPFAGQGGVSFAEANDRSSISSPAKALGAPSSTGGPFGGQGGVSFAEANDRLPPPPQTIQARGLWFNHPFGTIITGGNKLNPTWHIEGRWPTQIPAHPCPTPCPRGEVVLGRNLASHLHLTLNSNISLQPNPTAPESLFTIVGIASTDSPLDNQLLFTLADAQSLANLPDAISRVEVSARTKPEDAFARKDPDTLSPAQHEIWYCRPYANSIAYQIREAIPGADASQVRKIEQSEGTVLSRISGLMWLVSIAALLAAGFAVSAAMATAVLERRREIGLMRSLGASRGSIAILFYAETGLLAIAAGTIGYLAGSTLAFWLGAHIFTGDPAGPILNLVLLPVIVAMALIVAIAGSTPSIRNALNMDPSAVLRGDS